MNPKSLQVFTGLMEEGTLTRAAARMHLSQSAASRLLSLLESEVRTPLFVRDRRRMRPTAAADALYPEVLRLQAQIRALPEIAARVGHRPPLRILCQSRLAGGLVLPAIARFAHEYPDERIALETVTRRAFSRRLLAERHDLAIATLPVSIPGLRIEALGELPLDRLVPVGHPSADRTASSMAEPPALPYIALDDSTLIRRVIDAAHAEHGLALPIAHEVSSSAAACRLVAAGLGFTYIDRVALEPELADRVALVPCPDGARVTHGLLHLNSRDDPRATVFAQAVRSTFTARSHAHGP